MARIPHSFQQKIFRIGGLGDHFKDLVKDLISQRPSFLVCPGLYDFGPFSMVNKSLRS